MSRVTRPSHWKGEKNELIKSNSMGFGKELVAFVTGVKKKINEMILSRERNAQKYTRGRS